MKRLFLLSFCFLFLMAVIPGSRVWAAEIGQIKTLKGDVFLARDNNRTQAQPGDILYQADVVETGDNGSVGITFIDNSRFSAGPNTRIELSRFSFNPTTQDGEFITDMASGTLAVISGQIAKHSPEAMKVKTPTTILGFRGTKAAIKVNE